MANLFDNLKDRFKDILTRDTTRLVDPQPQRKINPTPAPTFTRMEVARGNIRAMADNLRHAPSVIRQTRDMGRRNIRGKLANTKKLTPQQSKQADVVVGGLSGFAQGVGAFGGSELFGDAVFGKENNAVRFNPETLPGRVAQVGGGIAGFAVGPGRITNPIGTKFAATVFPKAQFAGKLGGASRAIAAETAESALTTPLQSLAFGTDPLTTFGQDLGAGIVGRGVGELAGIPARRIKQALQKINPSVDDATATKQVQQFIRDELGRFATGKGKPSVEPKFYGDLREAVGLPRDGNYQGGFINVGEIAPQRVKQLTQKVDRTKLTGRQLSKTNQQLLESGYGELRIKPQKIKATIKQKAHDIYTQVVDRFHPVNRFAGAVENAGGKITTKDDPRFLTRRLLGANGIADLRFENEMRPILKQIEDAKIDTIDLDLYLKSRRDINLAGRGIKGSDAEVASSRIKALAEKYGGEEQLNEIAEKMYTFQRDGFMELVEAGFISPDNAEKILQTNEDYVPFQRAMEEVDEFIGLPTRNLHNPGKVVQKIKGSEKAVLSPLESVIGNIYRQRAAIEQNRVAKSIVNLGNLVPGTGITRVPKSKGNTISVWEDGKKSFYTVPQDVAEVVKGLNEENMGTLMQIMSAPARLLRSGATGKNPEFFIPNAIKDQFDAAINSNYGYVPFLDYARGFASMWKQDEVYQKWLASGGAQSFGSITGRDSISKVIKDRKPNKKLLGKVLHKGNEILEILSEFSEQPTRVGAFKKALEKTGDVDKAMLESRDITIDFARMGSKMKVANSLIPFLNVQVQAFDKLVKNAKNKPVKTALLGGAYGALPAITTTMYNMFNFPEEYAEIPEWEKENNLVIVAGKDDQGRIKYFKIPIGNFNELIHNPIRNFVEFAAGDDEVSFKEMATTFFSSALPAVGEGSNLAEVGLRTFGQNLPQIIKPVGEVASNKSFFRFNRKKGEASSIVPQYLKDEPPAEQKFDSTQGTYTAIGRVLNVSPLQVKAIMEGYLAAGAKIPVNIIEVANDISSGRGANPNQVSLLRRFFGEVDPDKTRDSTTLSRNNQRVPLFGQVQASEGVSSDPFAQQAQKDETFDELREMYKQSDISITEKRKKAKEAGVEPSIIERRLMTGRSSAEKTMWIENTLKSGVFDEEGNNKPVDKVGFLLNLSIPKGSSDKKVLSDKVIKQLRENGTLDELTAHYLKQAKWDEKNQKLNFPEQIYEVTPARNNFYKLATSTNDEKTATVVEMLNTNADIDRLQLLKLMRKSIAGEQVLTSGVIDKLYSAGYMTKKEKELFKSVTWDEETQSWKQGGIPRATGKRRVRSTKKVKVPKAKKRNVTVVRPQRAK